METTPETQTPPRRLAITKDGRSWAVCGPWVTRGDVPPGWFSDAAGECRQRDTPHQHILFGTWRVASTVVWYILSDLEPVVEPST